MSSSDDGTLGWRMLKPSQRNLKLYSHKPGPSPVEVQLHMAEVEQGPAEFDVLEKK
jgi:hypothetical protein